MTEEDRELVNAWFRTEPRPLPDGAVVISGTVRLRRQETDGKLIVVSSVIHDRSEEKET